jgi:hypothetical protein
MRVDLSRPAHRPMTSTNHLSDSVKIGEQEKSGSRNGTVQRKVACNGEQRGERAGPNKMEDSRPTGSHSGRSPAIFEA